MGAFLEKPITDKTSEFGEGNGLKYGVSAMQGWRKEMEDKHVCEHNFSLKDHSFFGVFDGHAGDKASSHCSEHLLDYITDCYTEEKEGSENDKLKKAIRKGFLNLDSEMLKKPKWSSKEYRGGTTAITVMVTPTAIIWGNCGDSRGILCRDGKIEFVTEDHKPYNPEEKSRIEKAGGSVMMQRVNGSLAVSRALGDFEFKETPAVPDIEQQVSPEPEVTVITRAPATDEYLLLACDGIYDVMTNEQIVAFVSKKLTLTDDLTSICSDLIDLCLHKNSRDNMSAILVAFKAAPMVSADAIKKENDLQTLAKSVIEFKIQEEVSKATDVLDLDEHSIFGTLTEYFTEGGNIDLVGFEVASLKTFIADTLTDKKKEKFGDIDSSNQFGEPASFDGSNEFSPSTDYFSKRTEILQIASDNTVQSDASAVESDLPSSTENLPPVKTDIQHAL